MSSSSHRDDREDLRRLLHEEIERLPERYRAPVVLCDLDGLKVQEAAQVLEWSSAKVTTNLNRGRNRLKSSPRLRRFAASAATWPPAASRAASRAAVPVDLLASTSKAAMALAAGAGATGAASATAIAVLDRVALLNIRTPIGLTAKAVLLLGACGSLGILLARTGTSGPGPRPADTRQAKAAGPAATGPGSARAASPQPPPEDDRSRQTNDFDEMSDRELEASGYEDHKAGRYDEAIRKFTAWGRQDPDRIKPILMRGWSEIEGRRYKEGEDDFRRATRLAPGNVEAFHGLWRALYVQAKFRESLRPLDRAIELDASDLVLKTERGLTYLDLGETERAIQELDAVIRAGSKGQLVPALNLRARALEKKAEAGDLSEADRRALLERAAADRRAAGPRPAS